MKSEDALSYSVMRLEATINMVVQMDAEDTMEHTYEKKEVLKKIEKKKTKRNIRKR